MGIKFNHQILFIFISFMFLTNMGLAEDPVEFADSNLKEAVEKQLDKEDPMPEDMLEIEYIGDRWYLIKDINDLKGLGYAKNLKYLCLESSHIQDFSVLTEFNQLRELGLNSCNISDISSIVSAIETHNSLRDISFRDNQISDISSLVKLKSQELHRIDLGDNPLNEDAYKIYIPQLREKFKGIEIAMPFRITQLIIPSILFVVSVPLGFMMIYRSWTGKGWILELLTGIVSAGLGCYLGLGAQMLYISGFEIPLFGNGYENPMWFGGVIGGVFGLLTGLWFAQHLRSRLNEGQSRGRIVGKGILVGISLGVICSTAVHILLIIAYHNLDIRPLLIGGIFGIGAGIATGLTISVVFILANKWGLIKTKEKI
jgi:hypothetical protein